MAKETDLNIAANFRNPEFHKRLEEAKRMVQMRKKTDAAYHILKDMAVDKDENSLYPFWHIPNRQLADMLGCGKGVVYYTRKRVREERGTKYFVKDVDTSQMRSIGRGYQSVYLYYFPAYKLNAIYYIKYIDDSYKTPIYRCNIGKTIGPVPERVSNQTGQQLPEKPKIALVIRTDDCNSLETEIHDELKKQGKWLDPAFENVVGEEWFLTNPAEVERIFKSLS